MRLEELTDEEITQREEKIREEFKDMGWDDCIVMRHHKSAPSLEQLAWGFLEQAEMYPPISHVFKISTSNQYGVNRVFTVLQKHPYPNLARMFQASNREGSPPALAERCLQYESLLAEGKSSEAEELASKDVTQFSDTEVPEEYRGIHISITPVRYEE